MSPRAGNPLRDSSLQQGPTTGEKSSPHFSTEVGLHNTSYTYLILSYGRARGAVLSASPVSNRQLPGRRLSSHSREDIWSHQQARFSGRDGFRRGRRTHERAPDREPAPYLSPCRLERPS